MKVAAISILAMVFGLCSTGRAVVFSYLDNPIEDATVDSVLSSMNFGGEETLRVQGYSEFPAIYSLGSMKRVYLKFDLSVIPVWAEIVSAEFGIFFAQGNQGGAATVDPHAALYIVKDDSWQEMDITWDLRPDFEPGYVHRETPLAQEGVYYTWNLLSDMGQNSWKEHQLDIQDGFLSLMLLAPDADLNNYAIFNSSEAASNLPYLSIGYVPEPGTLVMLGLGVVWIRRRK